MHTVVTLDGTALATSGTYRNHYTLGEEHVVHTLDPITGRPVAHRLLSASVLHARCAIADAWATALMAAGPERALELAQAHGLDVLLLIADERGGWSERATAGFEARRAPRDPGASSP